MADSPTRANHPDRKRLRRNAIAPNSLDARQIEQVAIQYQMRESKGHSNLEMVDSFYLGGAYKEGDILYCGLPGQLSNQLKTSESGVASSGQTSPYRAESRRSESNDDDDKETSEGNQERMDVAKEAK